MSPFVVSPFLHVEVKGIFGPNVPKKRSVCFSWLSAQLTAMKRTRCTCLTSLCLNQCVGQRERNRSLSWNKTQTGRAKLDLKWVHLPNSYFSIITYPSFFLLPYILVLPVEFYIYFTPLVRTILEVNIKCNLFSLTLTHLELLNFSSLLPVYQN